MQQDTNVIRSMVRGIYALQQLRIQMGNRITVNFKAKLGLTQDGMSEAELEAVQKSVLDRLRVSYNRITDGIVEEGDAGKLPSLKKFVGDEVISSYAELVLVKQYMGMLLNEEEQFKLLKKVLAGIPIYDQFLEPIKGVGPALAGIIISEIDISRSKYASSVWKYCGLDVITVGKYTDEEGKEHKVHPSEIDKHFELMGDQAPMLYKNKYPVVMTTEGRSRKEQSLVTRSYVTKDGAQAERRSITYNPFLKTKMIGVLGTALLRGVTTLVDGEKMGSAKRQKLAKELGYKAPSTAKDAVATDDEVGGSFDDFLRSKGHTIVRECNEYAQSYYDYRNRLNNMRQHDEKSESHKHAMSVRYMVKRFLAKLYSVWRPLEGLHAYPEYAEGVLGYTHGVDPSAEAKRGPEAKAA